LGHITTAMKTRAYCNRENEDDATHCRECGTAEFVLPPQHSTSPEESIRPLLSKKTILLSLICAIALLVSLVRGLQVGRSSLQVNAPSALSFLGNPTLSTTGVLVSVSNQSSAPVLYFACPPQENSNGVWEDVQMPRRMTLTRLPAKCATTVVVVAPTTQGDWRVPFIWGYEPSRHLEVMDSAMRHIRGRGVDLELSLSTNFSPQVSP
jgi:hypothetical protein